MDLENTMLRERGQWPKVIRCMIPCTWNVWHRQIPRDRKWVTDCQRLGDNGGKDDDLKKMSCFLGWWNVPKLWWWCTTLNILKTIKWCTLHGWIVWNVNYSWIKLLQKRRRERGKSKEVEVGIIMSTLGGTEWISWLAFRKQLGMRLRQNNKRSRTSC